MIWSLAGFTVGSLIGLLMAFLGLVWGSPETVMLGLIVAVIGFSLTIITIIVDRNIERKTNEHGDDRDDV
jgi:tetrahydromethanopterin S-methyltransferase subunit E